MATVTNHDRIQTVENRLTPQGIELLVNGSVVAASWSTASWSDHDWDAYNTAYTYCLEALRNDTPLSVLKMRLDTIPQPERRKRSNG